MTGATTTDHNVDFDIGRLDAYLRKLLGGGGATEVERTQGGMSNPTYFLRRGDWRAVLRKQPGEVLMPALQGSAAPTPKPLHYCADRDILGTPFYLMERLNGRVFHEFATPGLEREERRALFGAMCAAMAAIHRLDYRALGLGDYGRPGNYFARQLKRWSGQWSQFRHGDDDNPDLDHIVRWLSERVPDSELLTLCHGDFRIANIMFHASEPRVIGVLDWELSTLGHPLVDLAFNSQAWRMAPDENGGLRDLPLAELGIPSEADYLDLYYRLADSKERLTVFHQVFAMFRGAVGSAGVAARGAAGNGVLPDAARVGRRLALAYARRGVAMIEGVA
jgi:aminoglycoside phosphotransferase (APT) family kinase protein